MNFIKSRKFLLLLRCWGGVVCREWVLSFVKWIACMDECSLVLFLGCFLGGNEVRWISLRKRVSQPGTTSICSCCVILFIYWWIVFTLILWRMFESVLGLLACRIFEVQSSSGFFLVLQGYISIKYFEKCFVVVLGKVYIHWHWLFLNSFFKILREREHRWARTSVEVGVKGRGGGRGILRISYVDSALSRESDPGLHPTTLRSDLNRNQEWTLHRLSHSGAPDYSLNFWRNFPLRPLESEGLFLNFQSYGINLHNSCWAIYIIFIILPSLSCNPRQPLSL